MIKMRKARLRAAKLMTYVQWISFISIPVYVALNLTLIKFLSNGILLILSVGLVSFFVLKYLKITPYLKE